MIPESLKAQVKRATAGMSKGDALAEVARIFDPRIVAARVEQAVPPPEDTGGAWPVMPLAFKDRSESAGAGIAFTDEDEKLIRQCGQDPRRVGAEIVRMRTEKAASASRKEAGVLSLTAKEREQVAAMGHDPDEFVYCAGAKDAADHVRLKAEFRAARGGV